MLSSWNKNPKERPTFSQMVELLEEIMDPLADYMDFTESHIKK